MKKNLLFISLFMFSLFSSTAQTTLFGSTANGGSNFTGTIFNYQPASNTQHIIKNLDTYIGSPTNNNFIMGTDGKLYSMTTYGGLYGYGAIFSFDPATSTNSDIYDFNNITGANPFGSLLSLASGVWYGMTSLGGANNFGVIFSFDPTSSTYTDLYDFSATGGEQPYGSLIQATDGKLYGLTIDGGLSGDGVIFSFDPVSLTYTDIHDFSGADGEQPNGSLMQAADGKLYGFAAYGGANGDGVIFSMDTSTAHNYLDIYDFNGATGLNPFSSLIQGTNDKLYGLSPNGGAFGYGVLFSIDTTSAHAYADLYDFDPTVGSNPYGNLFLGADGNLYGTASGGGANDYGVIFSFALLTADYSDLYDFNNGQTPYSGLLQLPSGLFYGMTIGGGTGGKGVVFSFNPLGANFAVLNNFGSNQNGSHASASLLLANDGNLYGMTLDGGTYGAGVIYKVDTSTLNYTVVYNFDGTHGSNPYGSLIQASDGKFYGTTSEGGTNYHNYSGVLFSFDPGTSMYTDLYEFDDSSAGTPTGSLLQATDGKLYGMTSGSSTPSNGNIFSYDPLAATYANLYEFNQSTGFYPTGSLFQATDGNLYGLTLYGGANNYGSLFSFVNTSLTYTDLYDFNDVSGSGGNPYGSLIQAGNEKLYGLSSGFANGGLNSTLFSFDPTTLSFADVKDLGSAEPEGNLLLVSDSVLYGTTNLGGAGTLGNIFSYNLNSSNYADLFDFNGTNGANTSAGSALIAINGTFNLPVTLLDFYGTLKPDNTVLLQWQTAQEQNSSYFGVERSPDGKTFTSLAKVAAAGNSNINLSYSYLDSDPLTGNNFYRLSLVDLDGRLKYSQVLLIVTGAQGNSLEILNNPFTSSVGVKISLSAANKINLVLTDAIGRVVQKQSYELSPGVNFMNIYPPIALQPGVYLLNITGININQTVKLLKQ
jgi:uncharacterized repeat protein (TIGR03803 family)